MKNRIHYFSMVLYIVLSVTTSACFFAQAAERRGVDKVPTAIKAARMEYNADGQIVSFNGDVYVKRPDFELWASKVTIFLNKSDKRNDGSKTGIESMRTGDIVRIVAENNVRMTSNNKEGTCKKAIYYTKEDKFVMEGNPLLKDKDQNTIIGTTITHYIKENRSEVQNPTATFFTHDSIGGSVMPGGQGNGNK